MKKYQKKRYVKKRDNRKNKHEQAYEEPYETEDKTQIIIQGEEESIGIEYHFQKKYRLQHPIRFISRLILVVGIIILVFVVLQFFNNKPNAVIEEPIASTVIVNTPITATPSITPEPVYDTVPDGFVRKPLLIMIDPGHGGRDPGTIAFQDDTVYEKNITLTVAKMCEQYLIEKDIPVRLTRSEDVSLDDTVSGDLKKRAAIANEADATLFVSIHINSLELSERGAKDVFGMECYYAEKENCFLPITDMLLAEKIINSAVVENNNLSKGIIKKRYSVLSATKMPAVLIEIGYLSNSEDFSRLTSDSYLDKTAKGIANAIEDCVQQLNPIKTDGSLCVLKKIPVPVEGNHD